MAWPPRSAPSPACFPIGETRRISPARDLTDATPRQRTAGQLGSPCARGRRDRAVDRRADRRGAHDSDVSHASTHAAGVRSHQQIGHGRPSSRCDAGAKRAVLRTAFRSIANGSGDSERWRLDVLSDERNSATAEHQAWRHDRDVLTAYTTPGFFTLMKVPIVAGRSFSTDDTRAAMPVIIVNEMLARRIRPDGQVLGQRLLVTFLWSPPPRSSERSSAFSRTCAIGRPYASAQ